MWRFLSLGLCLSLFFSLPAPLLSQDVLTITSAELAELEAILESLESRLIERQNELIERKNDLEAIRETLNDSAQLSQKLKREVSALRISTTILAGVSAGLVFALIAK
jgi:chromosome segregation ATPase